MAARNANPGQFFWKLFIGNAFLLAVVLAASVWLLLMEFDEFHNEELTSHLKAQADAFGVVVRDRLDSAHARELDALAKAVGSAESGHTRITVVDASGMVLADSEADPSAMASHADREEIRQALAEGWGKRTRWSHTLSRKMKYVAVRIGPPETPSGVVRAAMAVPTLVARRQSVRRIVGVLAVVVFVTFLLLALGLARLWTRPLRQITAIAGRLSKGDMNVRARIGGTDELAHLAQALNEMRDHLCAHLETINFQRRTSEALLAQLHEGVVVADEDGRIVLLNSAARNLLDVSPGASRKPKSFTGAAVEECVPYHELQQMLLAGSKTTDSLRKTGGGSPPQAAGADGDTPTDELRLEMRGETGTVSVLARAWDIALPRAGRKAGDAEPREDEGRGRLLVLTDITELTKLIQMKTDFVANASHELRTPLSAIRASVETLMAMKLGNEADSPQRFLRMIDRHSARLEAMVADLLDLSLVESGADLSKTMPVKLASFFTALHNRWADALKSKKVAWQCDVGAGCEIVETNPQLLNLVLDNLVDNAIKFTHEGGHIRLSCRAENHAVRFEVADDGCGIAPEEQGRVFERFYQVEKARSISGDDRNAARGTGLGLSIVRHAVVAMNGAVGLTSQPGKGTSVSFTIQQGHEAPGAHLT